MRLMVITNIYPPQNLGGFGLCIERLTEGLVDLGYDAKVLTSDETYLGETKQAKHVIRSIELLGDYRNGVRHIANEITRKEIVKRNRKRVQKLINEFNPETCLIGNLDLIGKEILDQVLYNDIATIQHIGFMGTPFPGDWIPYKKPFRLAMASGEVKRKLISIGHRVEEHPIVYPPLGKNINEQRKVSITNRLRIGFVGLIMESKGLHILLEAAAMMQKEDIDYEIVVAGKIFSRDYYQKLIEFCGKCQLLSKVKWRGFVKPENLHEIYSNIDVLVFPSLYPESFGMVVAEAMSNGVLPITSGVGGAYEVVVHMTDGLLIKPDDKKDLYDKLKWCIDNKKLVEKMRKRAKKNSVLRFSQQRSAKTLDDSFKAITNCQKK